MGEIGKGRQQESISYKDETLLRRYESPPAGICALYQSYVNWALTARLADSLAEELTDQIRSLQGGEANQQVEKVHWQTLHRSGVATIEPEFLNQD